MNGRKLAWIRKPVREECLVFHKLAAFKYIIILLIRHLKIKTKATLNIPKHKIFCYSSISDSAEIAMVYQQVKPLKTVS